MTGNTQNEIQNLLLWTRFRIKHIISVKNASCLNDQPKAWMHASSSSSTVADCSDSMDSIVPFPRRLFPRFPFSGFDSPWLSLDATEDEREGIKGEKRKRVIV